MIAIPSLFVVSFTSALLTKQFLSVAASFLGFYSSFLLPPLHGSLGGGKGMTFWMVLSCLPEVTYNSSGISRRYLLVVPSWP